MTITVMPLTHNQIQVFQNICEKICSESQIKFCGAINVIGKLVAGGFKNSIKPLDNEEERKMWYMQSALEMSMKKEFSSNLGDINYIVAYRDNVTLINIPIQNHVILLSTEKNVDVKQIVDYSKNLFEHNKAILVEDKNITL
jgi:hypothetical protein